MSRFRKLPRFLNKSEIDSMLCVSKSKPRDSLILKCLFYLGLRISELQTLRVEDIDFINNTVKIICGKGKKDRYVPIPCVDLVLSLKHHAGSKTSGFLIVGQDRVNGMDVRHIRRIVKKYAVLAGIRKPEEIHPHTLRHSYATFLQNQGVPLNAIQQLLGHEDIETTTIYLHLGLDKIHNLVQTAFGGSPTSLSPFPCN